VKTRLTSFSLLGATLGLVASLVVPGCAAPPAPSAPADPGVALYRLVETYSALGDHRSGTPVDAATLDWFAAELQRRGARVERQPFSFDRYEASARVTIAGQVVPSLPLFYEGVGELDDDHPFIASTAVIDGDRPSVGLLDAIAKAKAAGAKVAVVATSNALGELQSPNRVPQAGSGLPVVLVPGRVAEALAKGPVHVHFAGHVVPGRSENIVAAFGDVSRSPIVIATPLSCWFTCAGERGTGVALAIALAERIAPRYPVLVVGSPAHELLPHVGLQAFLAQNKLAPSLVVHLGANVALGERDAAGTIAWAKNRGVGLRMQPAAFERLRVALDGMSVRAQNNPPRWFGEGELWAHAIAAPMLSFVGTGAQFHTPADTPANSTSPQLLHQAYDAIGGALDAWLALPAEQRVAAAPAPAASAASAPTAAQLLGRLRPQVEPYSAARIDEVAAKSGGLTNCFWVATVSPSTFNILYPDDGVTYWGTQYRLPAGAKMELRGRYPHARHISFSTYDDEGRPLDRIADMQIEPQPKSTNPFRPGARRDAAQRDYRVEVATRELVAGNPVDEASRARNTVYALPGDRATQIAYRVYVVDQDRDARGGVPLPEPVVTLADGRQLQGEALCRAVVVKDGVLRDVHVPAEALKPFLKIPSSAPYHPAQPQPRWNAFFNPVLATASLLIGTPYEPVRRSIDATRRGGFYGTLDNTYMTMYIDARYGELMVLHGKAPTTPSTRQGDKVMTSADLRYWSLCKYRSLSDTAVDTCLYDEKIPRDANGNYTIVVSKPALRPANARSECGVAWLPWGEGDGLGNPDGGFLMVRHMMPSDAFRPHSLFATRKPGDEQETLGPYYPAPSYMSRAQFEAQGCRPH
jgi:hypothetical protein